MSKVPAEVLAALRAGGPIPDSKLAVLSAFTQILLDQRGNPTPEQLNDFKAVGYTDRQVLEIVLAIAVKTLSNYCNHLFQTSVDTAFQKYVWQYARRCKTRPQCAARAVLRGGVKAGHRRILVL
jgi:hypothetical protein